MVIKFLGEKMDNSAKTGHINLILTLAISLVAPLALILLSYTGVISGTAEFVAAFGVIGSAIYIIGGGILIATQDKKDGENIATA
jgi:hypothetical protein